MRSIVIVGAGIAGVETALTLARGMAADDVKITLVGRWPALRLRPEIIYVPFGVSPRRIDVDLTALAEHGVTFVQGEVDHVDVHTHEIHFEDKSVLAYDTLIAAPGAQTRAGRQPSALRSLDQALALREQLASFAADVERGLQRTLMVRVGGDDSWAPPASEFAMLAGVWARTLPAGAGGSVEVVLVTADREPFDWFGTEAADVVADTLARHGVKVLTSVPEAQFDQLTGDITVDFAAMEANTVEGLPGPGPEGWYEVDAAGTLANAPDVYMVGDATTISYRSGFAAAWEARRLLTELGGSLDALADVLPDTAVGSIENDFELGDGTLRVRFPIAARMASPWLGHDVEVEVLTGQGPDKLSSLLLHVLLITSKQADLNAPRAFHDVITSSSINT